MACCEVGCRSRKKLELGHKACHVVLQVVAPSLKASLLVSISGLSPVKTHGYVAPAREASAGTYGLAASGLAPSSLRSISVLHREVFGV